MMSAETVDTDIADLPSERTRTARTILLEAALLGVLADGAMRSAPDGFGWTVWVIGLAFASLNVARRRGLNVTREQIAWVGAAVACAAAFAWRDTEELRAFNILGTLVALAMFSMAAAGMPVASILVARIRDVITAGLYTIRDIVVGAPVLVVSDADPLSLPAVRGGASWTALRAVLLTVPLVLVFIVLFSRADPVFASVFSLPALNVERVVEHVVVIGAFTWWSAGFIRGALLGVSHRPALPDRLPIRLGVAEITMSLGAVITLFAIFVALQLRWLFGGADVVLATTGLTVAEYARRGFFELVAVAALVLPLILVTRAVIEDEKVIQRHRHLSLALIVLLAAIMVSALLRMQLYISYFGLTTDRLFATALMAWLGLVSLALARTVFRGWSRPFAAMTVITGFITLLALNAANPELLVARVNLGRVSTERGVDYEYLARLSGDAVPVVVNALTVASPSASSCNAARHLRSRWLERTESWNLGARRGRESVSGRLTEAHEARLCIGMPAVTPGANRRVETSPAR
jgi:hypothetical protein